ncbi:MAG: RluA family pseudouridine synthase [Candidatus Kapaibacterium sp.]
MSAKNKENGDLDNYPVHIEHNIELDIAPGQKPERLDKYLAAHIVNATRNKVQKAIDEGRVQVNGIQAKASRKVQPGDHIECIILKPPPIELIPQEIPLNIIFEDKYLLIVNKPPGMCVHPGFGNRYGTLVNALLYHFGKRDSISIDYDEEDEEEGEVFALDEIRPGIVHRIDKDTSGLLVIAKDPSTHEKLARQFAQKTSEREYLALLWGTFDEDKGIIEGNIGRSPRDRKMFAVLKKEGKPAVTEYEVIERFTYLTLVKARLQTGRTHQIRVHFSHRHHPVFGDSVYGGDKILHGGHIPQFRVKAEKALQLASRQLLHAKTLGIEHPVTKEFMSFDSEIPDDMKLTLEIFRDHT